MAKAWKDVISSQQYQSLPPDQKAQAQEQYFNEVVAPQAGQNIEQAKQAFYSAYPKGLVEKGNIDIHNRPIVKNQDGSISTVRSMSTNIDGREVLIPTVSDDGRIMSDDEAIDNFMRTGRHLGMFDTPDDATSYAESLHNQQADEYLPQSNQPVSTVQKIGGGLAETGRGILQAATNVANIPAAITDAVVGAGAGVGKLLGLGDGSYPTAPRVTTQGLEQDFGLQPGTLTPQTTEGKVFSEALPYLTPVGIERAATQAPTIAGRVIQAIPRLAAESATGTLASNSESNNAEKLATDLAANVAIGGGVNAIGSVIGSGYRAIRGSIAPEAQQAIRFADQNNAPLLTTDVVQPGTFSGRSAQALGEKVPITGTGSVRRAQQEARSNLVDQYAQRFDAPAPDEIVSSLQRQTSKVKSAAGERLSDVNAAMQSAGQIRPDSAIKSIDDEINRLSRLGGAADNQTISKLKIYRDELDKGADFGLLRDLRTQFRQDVKGDRVVWPNQSEASVNRVYSSLTGDLNKAVSDKLGSQAASRYNQANAIYANEAKLVKNTRLKNVLQKGDLTPEVVNTLLFSNKPSEVRKLYGSLDSRGRSAARASVIGKAYEKSSGSPDRFLNELNRLSSQTGIIFKGTDRQYLNGLKTYLDQTRRASRAGAVTPTGQELFQVAVPAGIASDVVGTGGVGTATGLGYGALARVYESAPVRNAMLRLANTPRGSSAFEKNLQAVEDAISVVTRASVSAD